MMLEWIRRMCRHLPIVFLFLTAPLFAAGDLDKLIAGLDHPLWSARRDAAEGLADAGPAGRDAIPRLIESLADVEPVVRRASAWALGAVGTGSEQAVQALVGALRDEDWVVRREAVRALQMLKTTATTTLPALRDALSTGTPATRKAAVEALAGLAPASKDALPELIEALGDADWRTQAAAARAIGNLGEEGRDGVTALAESLRNPDWRVAEPVVESLSRIGAPAIPVLIDGLQDAALPVRWGSARALGVMGKGAIDAVPALAAALEDEQIMVRWTAANALWSIGPGAGQATAALNAGLSDEQWIVRWSVARALGAIAGGDDPPGDETVSGLAMALRDEDSRVCEAAAFALEDIGMPAREALPALSDAVTGIGGTGSGACKVIDVGPAAQEVLFETGWTVRWAAVRALGVVGAESDHALPALTAALEDQEWQVRGVAALAVGQFGDEVTGETVTALINGLGDDYAPVRMAVASALGEIGIGARQAVPGLRNLQIDEDPQVRAAAEEAVSKISATQ